MVDREHCGLMLACDLQATGHFDQLNLCWSMRLPGQLSGGRIWEQLADLDTVLDCRYLCSVRCQIHKVGGLGEMAVMELV
jgi:hypothetical protein